MQEFAKLDAFLGGGADAATGAVVAVISGAGGVGKPNLGIWHTSSQVPDLCPESGIGSPPATQVDRARLALVVNR